MMSPSLLLIRMNAADTSASRAIADWMLLTDVSRSDATAVIDTFMIDVSTTRTNIAIANSTASLLLPSASSAPTLGGDTCSSMHAPSSVRLRRDHGTEHPRAAINASGTSGRFGARDVRYCSAVAGRETEGEADERVGRDRGDRLVVDRGPGHAARWCVGPAVARPGRPAAHPSARRARADQADRRRFRRPDDRPARRHADR